MLAYKPSRRGTSITHLFSILEHLSVLWLKTYAGKIVITFRIKLLMWWKSVVVLQGDRDFIRWFNCRYCYQTHESVHRCTSSMGCHVAAAPLQTYEANCTVKDDILCLGLLVTYLFTCLQ